MKILKYISRGLIIIFFLLAISVGGIAIGASSSVDPSKANCSATGLSEDVKKLEPKIKVEMEKQSVDDSHLEYILAMLNQESGGKGNDPFQASESKCGAIGCIKNVDESIEQGIKVYKGKINYAKKHKVKPSFEVIAQSYNFGSGYIIFLKENKYEDYTEQNALEYSKKMCGKAGTSPQTAVNEDKSACYGDYKYIEHIKRYLNCSEILDFSGNFVSPYDKGEVVYLTQKYKNPNGWYSGGFHLGVDLSAKHGANIRSISDGEVVADSGGGGYGTYLKIKARKDLYIIYGHMIEGSLKVKKGDKIKAGTIIGKQGSTGFSTGSHLHLECRRVFHEIQDLRYTYDPNSFINIAKIVRK